MKKSIKRFLCSTLSVLMAGTLVAEQVLRTNADASSSQTVVTSAKFTDVTGKYDTSAIREANFNSKVQQAEEVAPTYETRTVMVTLDGDCLSQRANGMPVQEFVGTFTGNNAVSDIKKEQNAFLTALSKTGISYKTERRYNTLLNAVAIEVDTSHVSYIKKMAGVESVVITTTYAVPEAVEQSLDINSLTNATSVYKTGIYNTDNYTNLNGSTNDMGEGTVVAILDTGLDYTHDAFQRTPDNYAWTESIVAEKMENVSLRAEEHSAGLNAHDVYVSEKVPFAYDYADKDADVYPSYSNHGTHVAGIIGGYDENGYTDKDGNAITDEDFRGVVPDAQLVICKVFTDDLDDKDLGSAEAEDIIAALEDCVMLGVDVINMSLGTSCGFSTTDDGDDEGTMLNNVYENIQKEGISLICAASNDYSSAYGGEFGTNKKGNPDSSTVGSPSTFSASLSVASINGQKASYFIGNEGTANENYVFFEESRDTNGNAYDFVDQMLKINPEGEFEYVVVSGTGSQSDYPKLFKNGNSNLNRIALVKRGDSTFQDKVTVAKRMGAIAIIVYNNVSGLIRMNLGDIDNPIPAISIDLASGNKLVEAAGRSKIGKFRIGTDLKAGPFMSEFSSWGPTHDLKLKPEITAHGGEITSTVPGGYGEQSGTSMASPNMAGVMAIIRNYIKGNANLRAYYQAQYDELSATEKETWEKKYVTVEAGEITGFKSAMINRLANQLIMSTATTVRDTAGLPYSPRKQGAGLGSLDKVVGETSAFLWVDNSENDYRPKLEIGDDPAKSGEIDQSRTKFNVSNFGTTALSFTADYLFFTETLSQDKLAVAEQAYMLDDVAPEWYVNGEKITAGETITVGVGETVEISVKLQLSANELEYMKVFDNGMYLEGFLKLIPTQSYQDTQCELTLPFLGFHGDWELAPMLDYDAYTIAENEADPSVEDEDKIKASVWATQPYSIYYNEKYILPMGSFVYLVDERDDPVYTDMDYNAVSRYNEYLGEGNPENYLTTTGIKALYAGLLRNARVVKYKLINEQTGEVVYTDKTLRVGKAYSGGGGGGVPANVEIELIPETMGLTSNGLYRMEFEFYQNDPDEIDAATGELKYNVYGDDPTTEAIEDANNTYNTYSFTFTVDYEAPVLEDVRVRYYNRKVDNREVQDIYLDIDVFDNHYAQAIMLCYPKETTDGLSLQLATEYATPIRKPNKNGTTTVSINITDIYEKYGSQFYLQIDDYAVNSCLYQIDINEANAGVLPEGKDFALAAGEDKVTLDIYETHKVGLVASAGADLSNFTWTSSNPSVANVRNGQIVGLSQGEATVTVSNRKGENRKISVTVTKEKAPLVNAPSITFGPIKTAGEALKKAQGGVEVSAGKTFNLSIEKDPWYHPMDNLTVVYASAQPEIAKVDQKGVVTTLKKGTANITATLYQNGKPTFYIASVTLMVQDEFDVSNYVLYKYSGIGYNDDNGVLWIPGDRNIMTIGPEAFKDNDNVRKIVIPASVTEIKERAFENCTALEEIYFVSTNHRVSVGGNGEEVIDTSIDWADLSLVNEQAFYNCKKLKKVDFSNVKTITLARETFKNCTALQEIVALNKVGTLYHEAFAGCTSLKSVDLTGTFVTGENVFADCTLLSSIKTGKYTSIGKNMFKGCTALRTPVTLYTGNIGEGAFTGCSNLTGVKFMSADGNTVNVDIGAKAFAGCGNTAVISKFIITVGNNVNIRTVGANAFANEKTTTITLTDAFDMNAWKKAGLAFENITVTLDETYRVSGTDTYETDKYFYDGTTQTLYNKAKTRLLYVNKNTTGAFTVPASVTEIGEYAFANSGVTSVAFATGTAFAKLGEGAFYQSALKSVDFTGVGASFTQIPAYAFFKSNVASITLPDTVVSLGDYAFADSAIASLQATGLTQIGNGAFYNCDNISTVYVGAFNQTGIAIPNSVTKIGDYAFAETANLISATLPTLLENGLGDGVFYNAASLTACTFGAGTTTTGNETFIGTKLTSFTFQDTQTVIGTALFMDSKLLTEITLATQTQTVSAYAFAGCVNLTTVHNLNGVVVVEDMAFYNTALKSLDLSGATQIGYRAFAYERNNAEASYLSITFGAVEKIGSYAFLNGAESTVDLPASVTQIGYGAFASSANLKGFKTNGGSFVAMDTDNDGYGVLYRVINAAKGEYELVCYPANRVQAETNGKKVYTVKEGTLYVLADAFMDLNKPTNERSELGLDTVVLTHAVNAIGDNAFYNAGIQEYVFESVQAPILELRYREEVAFRIKAIAEANSSASYYKGFFYSNFEEYFLEYTQFGDKTSNLTMYYPTNGLGYNNYVYGLYFPTRLQTTIVQTDATRDCIATINGLDVTLVESWMQDSFEINETNKQTVLDFVEKVEATRAQYKSVSQDKTQLQFIQDAGEKLTEVEEALYDVKVKFSIQAKFKDLRVDYANSTIKKYTIGERFELTGLKVLIRYQDGSTEEADFDKLSIAEDYQRELKTTDEYVVVHYNDGIISGSVNVYIDVSTGIVVTDSSSGEEETGKKKGCGSAVTGMGIVLATLALGAVVLRRKEN